MATKPSEAKCLEQRTRLVEMLAEEGICNQVVLDAIRAVPRHQFVPTDQQAWAYENSPLPIRCRQTISQPSIVARMTEAALGGEDRLGRVLEIGTGSGYQTAVLARVADAVYSVERIHALLSRAEQTLRDLDINNVKVKFDDGRLGWPEHGPYDAIVVTAAAESVPMGLVEQLEVKGRMIVPVGAVDDVQKLTEVRRHASGVRKRTIGKVLFVPLCEGVVPAG